MSLTFAIAVYFVVWWTVLFAVLPFGVHTQHEAGTVVPGTPASAPVKPALLRIVMATTLISAIVMAVVYAAIVYRFIDLRGPTLQPPPAMIQIGQRSVYPSPNAA